MPTIPFRNQQDLQGFVASPDEYIPERQANLTMPHHTISWQIQLNNLPPQSHDDSEARPIIINTDVNQALEAVQLYIIQTAPSTATLQDTASVMDCIP